MKLDALRAAAVAVLAAIAEVVKDGRSCERRMTLTTHVSLPVESLTSALICMIRETPEAEGTVVIVVCIGVMRQFWPEKRRESSEDAASLGLFRGGHRVILFQRCRANGGC